MQERLSAVNDHTLPRLSYTMDVQYLIGLLCLTSVSSLSGSPLYFKNENVIKAMKEIEDHKDIADRIIDQVLTGPAKNQVYNRLAEMVDKFGHRMCGTPTLEKTIDYMVDKLTKDGLENVHKEKVSIPHWVRGKESAAMLKPRRKSMAMLGLGYSVATPKEGITAHALVVKSFDELKNRSSEAEGKIVVFNEDWKNYGQTVQYRSRAASEAAKYGALATLVRSVTGLSIYSPHTGMQMYEDGVKKIPTACITVEDAEMLWRMQQRGEEIVLYLYMEAQLLANLVSYNTVAEIKGSTYPDEVVMVSGHLDSWDVGQGAMDDGGGAFISWEALSLIHQLGLRPKRTLRLVLWTCEELGLIGGVFYFNSHKSEATKMDLVMESDSGTFTPTGLAFTGTKDAEAIMKHLASTLLVRINATQVKPGAELSDITQWPGLGVPAGSITTKDESYFDFHHSNGDTMTVQDPHAMDLCSAVWAIAAYTVADLDEMLPANRTVK